MLKGQVKFHSFKNHFVRTLCQIVPDVSTKVLYPLKNRSLVKVSGNDVKEFLQGLITNDMNHFTDGALSMYAMFLNHKGRVLYDTLIHKWPTGNTFMVECDSSVQTLLRKHLNMYKLKRDVHIGDASQFYKIYALIIHPDFELQYDTDIKCNMNLYKDPRLAELGYRLISTTDAGQFDLQDSVGKDTVLAGDDEGYQTLKYKLGVSEGAEDLFPGTCLPLEANCDYLHGVSFHKGCYIGQELTARVHHTGVVRKRIMPLKFSNQNEEKNLEKDTTIWALTEPDGKTNVGKLKSYMKGYGLGLVRIKEALEAKALSVGEIPVEITKPNWWPLEAPKEKLILIKSQAATERISSELPEIKQ